MAKDIIHNVNQDLWNRKVYFWIYQTCSVVWAFVFYFVFHTVDISIAILIGAIISLILRQALFKSENHFYIDQFNVALSFVMILIVALGNEKSYPVAIFYLLLIPLAAFLLSNLASVIGWTIATLATLSYIILFQYEELLIGASVFTYRGVTFLIFTTLTIIFAVIIFYYSEKRSINIAMISMQHQNSLKFSNLGTIGRIAGGLAEEIKKPVQLIKENSLKMKSILVKETNDSHPFERSLDIIVKTSDRISKISKTLEELALNEDSLELSVLRVDHYLESLNFESQNLDLIRTKLSIQKEIPLDLNFYGNKIALDQIMLNLIQNSSHAIASQENSWIKVTCQSTPSHIQFRVTDSGKGIDTKIAEKIFSPFFTTKEIGKGTGLGLSLCLNYANKMKGQMYLNQNSPHTEFVVELRRA